MKDKIKIRGCKCEICNGIGLLETNTQELCRHCNNVNGNVCYLCENKGGCLKIKECDSCCGYGRKFYEADTNTQIFLCSFKNYKLV